MAILFKILLGLDSCLIALLTYNMVQPTFKPGESRLILLFMGILGMAWYLRSQHPKIALLLVALPVLTPLLVWVFLAVVFVLFSATK